MNKYQEAMNYLKNYVKKDISMALTLSPRYMKS